LYQYGSEEKSKMFNIISALLNPSGSLLNFIPWKRIAARFGTGVSGGGFFSSRIIGWAWHQGQIEITFLDTLWVMAVLVSIWIGLVFAARNAYRKPIVIGIGAAATFLTAVDLGFVLVGCSLNFLIQLTGFVGPALARFLVG
jgi:hypothetical protein